MTTGTPIFDDLVRLFGAGALQPTEHTPEPAPWSPCTPPEWFGGWFAGPEIHNRDPEATAVMPAAGQERQAS